MRILVTTSRMPYAVDEIRKLGRQGHTVHAADTFGNAPGNHSRFVHRSHVMLSPRYETGAYIEQLVQLVADQHIDVVLPAFEEVFYMQRSAHRLEGRVKVFAPSFDVLHQLHDKARFVALARELGVPTPQTIVVDDQDELRRALGEFPRYFARPAYSRGGVYLLTNTGPLAGAVPISQCHPTPSNPWLVQEFVEGLDICTFTVAREGRIAAHSAYVHPMTMDSAGGIVYESIVDDEALALVRRFVEATRYDGQVSFDFLRTDRALYAVECNPRPTAGLTIMPDAMLDDALFGPVPDEPRIAPAGARRHIWAALLRDMVLHWRRIPKDFRELVSGSEDLYAARGDRWPGLYQFLSMSHVYRYRRGRAAADRTRSDLLAGYFYDVSWDGDPLLESPTARLTDAPGAPRARRGNGRADRDDVRHSPAR
jgi:predicted ATP-grasp superfamily ATP-dependent carboligase